MKRVADQRYLSAMETDGSGLFGGADRTQVFELLFRSAAEGMLVVNAKGVILLSNPRLATMFGYEEAELYGEVVEVLLPDALHKKHAAHREGYHNAPVQRSMGRGMDLFGKRKDGSVFPVEVSLNHFQVGGAWFVMGLVTDISLRYAAEVDLQNINQELEQRVEQRTFELKEAEHSVRQALEKERELHSLKSRFVAMASHEFRTPLSTIMSSVDLIARYSGTHADERVEKHVQRIRGKVREMTAMLNEFLSLERIEQGHMKFDPVRLDIVDLCIELMEELRAMAKRGQTIDYDHIGDTRVVEHDRQMLSNVVTNLITNAVKYTPEGKRVSLRSNSTNGQLLITVEDEGMGIPKEDQQHLFERFFRGSNATTIQGTGLGLNLVKRYLDLMEGTITFESRPGRTSFTVQLPLRTEAKVEPPNLQE